MISYNIVKNKIKFKCTWVHKNDQNVLYALSSNYLSDKRRGKIRRTPKDKGGYQYAVLVTTLTDREPVELADAYDGRAMIEATFCEDKQALGLVTRRQRRWEAQQMVLLLARLAHHLLLWGKQWLSRVPATRQRLRGFGLVRLLRDVWAVPGVIRWRRGWMVSVRFSPLHPLATPLQASFSALFRGRVRVGILR